MSHAIRTAMDSAGRLVLPKAVRDEAGLLPGMALQIRVHDGRIEIEPITPEVRIGPKGRLRVAVPVETGPALTEAEVERVRRELREQGG